MNTSWQPSASNARLQQRAKIIQSIRTFFSTRNILEVETPLLADSTASDPQLESLELDYLGKRYLQTSPEQHMKRLLCAGSGDIFQICKAFRKDEQGNKHNPEFTILEWYRLNTDIKDLATETCQLIQMICNLPKKTKSNSYNSLFNDRFNTNPSTTNKHELIQLLPLTQHSMAKKLNHSQLTDLIFSHHIEPHLGTDTLQIVHSFPPSQASLSQTEKNDSGEIVSMRFEIYWQGTELANGYKELLNSTILQQRYQQDCLQRIEVGKTVVDYMQRLHQAMASGLPPCCGVALGVDRLIMLATSSQSINEVISFPFHQS